MGIIPYERLYRLPFSKNDNFNGWLEITELCNMSYPGCYRGCDRPEHQGGNKPLRELKAEVLELRRLRNCSMISIAGGEPLVHPDLTELVRFIASQRMKPVILTNGKLLTDDKLLELSRAGLVGVMIRVDSLQEPSSGLTENDLFEKREKFAALCARAGIYLTLTICTDKSNLPFVPDVLQWAEKNASRVGQVLIILKRALMFTREDVIDESGFVYPEELYSLLAEKIPGFAFSAYLGSEGHSLQAKWLQGYQYVLRGKSLGCGDKKLPELIQACYHYLTGSYLSLLEKKKTFIVFPALLLLGLLNRSVAKMARNFLIRALAKPWLFFGRASHQAVTVVCPPHFVHGRRDLCDACPDAILYEGELVPSCGLEEIRAFGKLYETN